MGVGRVDKIILAGAFGAHISPKHAMVLGMIPDCKLENVVSAGNAAGTGARIALLNKESRNKIELLVNNITKIDIAKELSKKTGYSLELSKILINNLLIVLISAIKKNKLNLKNIGTFRLINKSERIGRNPITKENFVITSRKSISFIASKKLLSVVNLSK